MIIMVYTDTKKNKLVENTMKREHNRKCNRNTTEYNISAYVCVCVEID